MMCAAVEASQLVLMLASLIKPRDVHLLVYKGDQVGSSEMGQGTYWWLGIPLFRQRQCNRRSDG